jgi:hypothetical protein
MQDSPIIQSFIKGCVFTQKPYAGKGLDPISRSFVWHAAAGHAGAVHPYRNFPSSIPCPKDVIIDDDGGFSDCSKT